MLKLGAMAASTRTRYFQIFVNWLVSNLVNFCDGIEAARYKKQRSDVLITSLVALV